MQASFLVAAIIFILIIGGQAKASVLSAPIIDKIVGQPFQVSGQAEAGNEILIYLDDKFVGYAIIEATAERTEIFNFNFAIALSDGSHKAIAIARDKSSLLLSAPSKEVFFNVGFLPVPTLVQPNETTITAKGKPLITGLTVSGSRVKIFIDGVYNGQTEILSHPSGTANFTYWPFLNLRPGKHELQLQTQDAHGVLSRLSAVQKFTIELPMPAPTMYRPVVNTATVNSRPFIVGLAKNDSSIKVFIDKKYFGQFKITNHPSGTANFVFLPPKSLTNGQHLVYTTATDARGKESSWSNIVYFRITQPSIAQGAEEENKNNVSKITEPQPEVSQPLSVSQNEGKILPSTDNKTGSAGQNGQTEASQPTGAINETKQNQGKPQLNLIIFLVFLVGIVAWLVWVNRELVKERSAKGKSEAAKNDNQITQEKK